jgi:osmotically-inducible protein OsmY
MNPHVMQIHEGDADKREHANPPGWRMTDAAIREYAMRDLDRNPATHYAKLGFRVHQGVVTLEGRAPSCSVRTAAAETVARIPGVLSVVNNIAVNTPAVEVMNAPGIRRDSDVATLVRRTFEWNMLTPRNSIDVAVANGRVALLGIVDSMEDKLAAVSLAKRLPGVTGVDDSLQVVDSESALTRIKSAIGDELARHARVEADSIALEIVAGTVVVAGSVDSAEEKQLVLDRVRAECGNRKVKDRLDIDPRR